MNEMTPIPHNVELERSAVATLMMYYGQCVRKYNDLLTDGLIYDAKLEKIYNAIRALGKGRENEDGVTAPPFIYDKLGGDSQQLVTLPDIIDLMSKSDPYHFGEALRILHDYERRRRIRQIGEKLEMAANDLGTTTESAQSEAIEKLTELFQTAASDIKTVREVAERYDDDVIQANIDGTRPKGIPTGFADYDNDCGGFQPSQLVVIAGATSMGKSALALTIAKNTAASGVPTAYYSLEMTAQELYARMAAAEIGIPAKILNLEPLTDEQLQRYHEAEGRLKRLPLYFDEKSTNTFDNICSSIRTMVFKNHVGIVFVDFLQRISFPNVRNFNKEQVIGDAINKLADLAKELKICVVVLSQLNRDKDNPRPILDRLRDSGQIEQAAHVVWLIYRPEYYENPKLKYPSPYERVSIQNTALIDVAKGRGIGKSKFILGFNGSLTKFFNLSLLPERGTGTTEFDEWEDDPDKAF